MLPGETKGVYLGEGRVFLDKTVRMWRVWWKLGFFRFFFHFSTDGWTVGGALLDV